MNKNILSIRRKQLIRLCVLIIIYLAAGILLAQVLDFVSEHNNNRILNFIVLRMDVLFILYAIIGISIIFFIYQYKTWAYIIAINNAIEFLKDESNAMVKLPQELGFIENQINEYKIENIMRENKVRNSEIQQQKLMMYLAHDIRTPLTSVLGYLNILADEEDLPSKQRIKYINTVLHNAETLENLINELFEMSKYESVDMKIEKQKVSLKVLLSQLLDEFYPSLKAKKMTYALNMDDEIMVNVAPELFGRAIGNLIKNAIIYGKADSTIYVSSSQNEINTEIAIKNIGKGIPTQYINSIFEEFDRGAEKISSGTGLGLPIAKGIIKLHGGSISVSNVENEITFIVVIPN